MKAVGKMTDAEIRKCVKEFVKGFLDGSSTVDKCYMVCSPLAAYLSFGGVECTLTEGEVNDHHHFWITLKDGRIIDPTADQFGLLNIWLRKQPSYYKMYKGKDYDTIIKGKLNEFFKK